MSTATMTPETPTAARPLAGKVALVTGAGRGIGRGIALALGRRGARVVVNYSRSADAAAAVVAELRAGGGPEGAAAAATEAVALQADVSRPAEVADLFARALKAFGVDAIDIVVSNAGMEAWADELAVTPAQFDAVFGLNCRGQFFVAQAALRHGRRGGRIVLTSSVAAGLTGVPNHALYAGSKAAVEGFTRAFAVDAGAHGITVNCIAPGGVQTDMFDANAWHYVPGGHAGMAPAAIVAGLARACPLQRVGTPADIGRAVALLVSEESEWINGQVIKLSGGSAV